MAASFSEFHRILVTIKLKLMFHIFHGEKPKSNPMHSGPILGFLSNGYIIKYFLKFIENILWCKKIFEAKRVILIQENRKMVVSQTSCQWMRIKARLLTTKSNVKVQKGSAKRDGWKKWYGGWGWDTNQQLFSTVSDSNLKFKHSFKCFQR